MTASLSRVWRIAASELGFDVIAPFSLGDEASEPAETCAALVLAFGSPSGTVVVGRGEVSSRMLEIAAARGIFVSVLDELTYSEYERTLIVDTLNDWGWYGPLQEAPDWFTGRAWTE